MTKNDKEKDLKKENIVDNAEQKKKQEELLKKFIEENTKDLQISLIEGFLKEEIQRFVKDLESLKAEIENKKELFEQQHKTINEKLKKLAKDGKIKFDDESYKKSEEQFDKYKNFLTYIFQEIYNELEFYNNLIGDNPPQSIRVLKTVPDNCELFLKEKLKASKRHIRKLQKDLRISFSRYNFSFDEQIKKLDYIDKYLKLVKK